MSENTHTVKDAARLGAMPATRAAAPPKRPEVFFPCVHGERTGTLVGIWAFAAPQQSAPIKVVSSPIDEDDATRVISASRYWEFDSRKANGVIASISASSFSGASYELALAIVDKLARYGMSLSQCKIIATGRIPSNERGLVAPIEQFATKLRVIAAEDPVEAMFVYPRQNLNSADDEEQQLLEQLRQQGMQVIAVSEIDDLNGLLWSAGADTARRMRDEWGAWRQFASRTRAKISVRAFLMLTLLLAASLGTAIWQPQFVWDSNARSAGALVGDDADASLSPKPAVNDATSEEVAVAVKGEIPAKVISDLTPQSGRLIESELIDTSAY